MIAIMVVVWLCSVLHPCQRVTIEGHRYRLRLPQTVWLESLPQHEQGRVSWADPKPEPPQKFFLEGLVQIDFTQLQSWRGPLTAWSKEGVTLHEYFHCPIDSFLVRASKVFCLDEKLPVYHKMDSRDRESTVKGSDGIFLPVGISPEVLDSGFGKAIELQGAFSQPPHCCKLGDVLQDWGLKRADLGQLAAYMLPQPVCALLCKGRWQDLLCVSRWAWFKSPQSCSGTWEGFRLPEALKAVAGEHEQLGALEPLELQQLELMLQNLRRWSPAILGQCDTAEDRVGEQLSLEAFANWLRQLVSYFAPHFATSMMQLRSRYHVSQPHNTRHGHQRYSDNQLVGMVLFAWHLRNSVVLKEAMPSALESMFPGFFQKTTISLGTQVFFPK